MKRRVSTAREGELRVLPGWFPPYAGRSGKMFQPEFCFPYRRGRRSAGCLVALLLGLSVVSGCAQVPGSINPIAWFDDLFGNSETAEAIAPAGTGTTASGAPRRVPSLSEKSAVPTATADASPSTPFDVAQLFAKLFSASGPKGNAAGLETPVAFTPSNPDPALKREQPVSPSATAQTSVDPAPTGLGASSDASAQWRETITVHFALGSAALSRDGSKKLRRIADLYREHGGKVRVIGHASSRTRDLPIERHKMINFEISLDRATRVANALVKLGVDSIAIQTMAMSDNEPLYHEWMPSGEAGNRRTEVSIEY